MRFSIRDLLLLTVIVGLSSGWWLERRTLTQSHDSWRVKAEELERATVPYTYSGGSTLGGFYQETIRIPIVPDELQRALTRAEEAEAELRQRRIVEAKL